MNEDLYGDLSIDDIRGRIDEFAVEEDDGISTGTPQILDTNQVSTETPSTEEGGIRGMSTVYEDRIAEGRDPRRPGALGWAQDVAEGTVRGLYEGAAPLVGIADTIIDTVNLLSAGGPDIPKLPKYESDTIQALRNISGLIIPSLGLRSMALNAASKYHAAGSMATKAPWLYKLGNKKSFEYFAKVGIDIGTGGIVDYVAEQNQKDDNLAGVLKAYWPKTYQWIPNSIATTEDDTPGEKRAKNVNEGAIFGVLASIVEGAGYILKGGRSISRTSKFVPSKTGGIKNLDELVKDQYTDIVFSKDNPIEDSILRQYARKRNEFELLNEYYISKGIDPIDVDALSESDTLVRTKDPDGILGAAADEAHIQNPEFGSTHGRIGNIVNEATRKEGIELENLSNRTLVSQLADDLTQGGSYGKRLKSNKFITDKMIDDAGKKLAATILNPRVEPDEIIGILDEFKQAIEGSAVRIVGKKAINRSIKDLTRQLVDLDTQKARAYLLTAEGGQIADMSEGVRLMEGGVFHRAVDAMSDRLEVLMVEKGLANFEAGSMLSHMDAWKKAVETGDTEIINQTADTILSNTGARLTEIIPDAKEWTNTLREVGRENPNFLRPLLLANEFTDGNIDSLYKLHQDASNRLGVFKKAVIDGNPEVPSLITKTWWSNLFNSTLSAMSTPAKAAVGNFTGLLGRGLATISGAALHGDISRMRSAMTAHFALDDTLQKATDHMKVVFRKASTNPKKVSYIMRDDIAIKEEKALDYLREYAAAASEEGEDGATMMLKIYEDLDALAQDPVLRFGGNAMTALDGFAKSVTANTEAKYLALNKLAQSGEEITEQSFKKAYQEIYDKWFDSNDMISNEAVDSITREIALNADSPIVDAMNNLVKSFPALRTFIRFPRTTANVIETFGKWGPAGILASDYRKMWGVTGTKKLSDFTDFEEIADILRQHGRPVDEFAMETFQMLRYETQGKVALGSLMVTMASFAAIGDRCTGNGHYNKSIQRRRVRSGWKPKSCSVPGTNKQVSYEWMGPIGDWLSLTIDVVDNFDSISTAAQEDVLNKLAFVFGSAFTNRSVLAPIEPLFDILQGNGAAASRFIASFGNDLVPLGAARNELGRILFPQLRQIRTDLNDVLRNRNAWLDAVDPERALPSVVDPVDGKPVGDETNWFLRVFNRGPAKVTSKPSKENKFLIDIEFNSSPMMRVSQNGAVLENHEITAIHTIMGEQGYYKAEINDIMQDANRLTYTAHDGTVYKGFVNILRAQRRGLISSDVLDTAKYANIFTRLKAAYADAKRLAENNLPIEMLASIQEREYIKINSDYNQKAGDINQVLDDAGLNETLNMAK